MSLIREYIRAILESSQTTFYHGSAKSLPIGTILEPQIQGYTRTTNNQALEDTMERYRPDGMIPRDEAVYLADNPEVIERLGGDTDYIYIVEPLGSVEGSDLDWYGEVASGPYLQKSEEAIREFAENYWQGVPYHGIGEREYRTRQARIVAVFEQSVEAA